MNDYGFLYEDCMGSYKTVICAKTMWFVADEITSETPSEDEPSTFGFVYAIEYGDGIKIGSTKSVRNRLSNIISHAGLYSDIETGEFCFSEAHRNFRENERIIHKAFANRRLGKSERFQMTLDDFFKELPLIYFDMDRAAAKAQLEKDSRSLFEMMGLGQYYKPSY